MHEILPINISFCVAPLWQRIQVFLLLSARTHEVSYEIAVKNISGSTVPDFSAFR
jgi:hypothetical protein